MDDKTEYSAPWWVKEIDSCESTLDQLWRTDADRAVDRYLDTRKDEQSLHQQNGRRFNVFWANVQIIKSALYATPPRPTIKRQHDDAKDDIARTAALILERIINFGFQDSDNCDMHKSIQSATEDLLIPGLGQVWARYAVETEEVEVPAVTDPLTGEEIEPAFEGLRIAKEHAPIDFVYWRDFLFSPARSWDDVWWVGRRVWMKRAQFVRRFGEEKWNKIKSAAKQEKTSAGRLVKGFTKNKAEVFELWCEDTNRAYWVSRHLDDVLDEKEDPLQLEGFFPCPPPLLATHTTNSIVPRCDYSMVADQYEELDVLNARISSLTRALRIVGVYDKNNVELSKILTGPELSMVPVDNWAAFAEAGGLRGQVDWFPVEVIAGVLEKLMLQRQAVIAQIYELTSISDIMRGASNPRDTFGAQKLKAQYSSVRLQLRQQEVALFVRDVIRLKCEIICRHWQPSTIKKISQIEMTESAGYADQAIALLKDYEATQYRVEVGEETLSLADYNAERSLRTEVLTAIGQFLSQSAQLSASAPWATPYLMRMIQWVTAAFRGSGDIETVLDEAIEAAEKAPTPQGEDDGSKEKAAEAQLKLQIADMVEKSRQQIAQNAEQTKIGLAKLDSETKLQVAQQDNATRLMVVELTNEVKRQAENIRASQESVNSQMEHALQRAKLAHDAILELMQSQVGADTRKLMEALARPRVRIPIYDDNGNISRIDEAVGGADGNS